MSSKYNMYNNKLSLQASQDKALSSYIMSHKDFKYIAFLKN